MRKIFLILGFIFLIFFINNVNSGIPIQQEIKNRTYIDKLRLTNSTVIKGGFTKQYFADDKRIKITQGNQTIIDLRLLTPYIVNGLIASENVKVAEFYLGEHKNISFFNIEIFNIKNNYEQESSRNFKYRYELIKEVCEKNANKTKEIICKNISEWIEFKYLGEVPNNVKIGLFTSTKANEYIEFVPTIYNFTILEWAAWNVTSATYLRNVSITAQDADPRGLFLGNSGNSMYVVGAEGDKVYDYSLSDAWNVSSATYLRSISVGVQDTAPNGIFFNGSGNQMYIAGATNNKIFEYSLSKAWNVSSASFLRNISVVSNAMGVCFNGSGNQMYITGIIVDLVVEYSLSDAWNVSSAVYLRDFSVAAQASRPRDVTFSTDGTKMYIIEDSTATVFEYSLSQAWNVSSAVYVENKVVSSQEASPEAVFLSTTGSRMYVVGGTSPPASVYEYNLTSLVEEDTVYPIFNNFTFSIENSSQYTPNLIYQFNVTILNANGTAGIEWQETNYSLLNLSSVFNKNFSDLGVGTYDYYWWAFGNGTSNLFNKTQVYSYTIIINSSLLLGITGTTPITYGTTTDVVGSNCPSQLTCSLDKANAIYGVGTEIFNYSTAGNTNYSAASITKDVVINQATGIINGTINGTQGNFTAEYGTTNQNIYINATNITGYGTGKIYVNGILYNSGNMPLFNVTNLSLGVYNITFEYDGNTNYSADIDIWWVNISDTINPQINLTYPLNTTYNINISVINYTVSDLNLAYCWYSIDNGVTNTSVNCGTNLTGLTSSEGSNIWLVGANDSSNNKNLSRVTFFKDTIYPLIDYGTGTAVNYANLSQNWVYVNTTWTEINFKNITFNLYNSSWNNITTYTTSIYLINWTNLANGNYWYFVNITDTAGNKNSTSIYNITLDTINPTINFTSPTETNNSYLSRNYVLINVTSTDTNLKNITINLYNSTNNLINSTFVLTSSNYQNISISVDGIYYFNATSTDTANNKNNTETRQITIDTINPQINLTYPLNITYNINVSAINYTVSDLNLDSCWYSTNNGQTNTSVTCGTNLTGLTSNEGSNTWLVGVNDSANNKNLSRVTFFKDTIYPIINLTYPLNITYNINVSALNYTVSDTNIQSCWYSTNNGATNTSVTCGTNLTGLTSTEGSNTWLVGVNDSANNKNLSRVTFFKDTVYPLWSNNKTDLTSSTILGTNVYFNITLNETNPSDYIFSWYNGTTWENTTNSYTNNQEVTINKTINIDIGTINWTWYINDTANNLNQTTIWSVNLVADSVEEYHGGGGGGISPEIIGKSLGIEFLSFKVCNLTYFYILENGVYYGRIFDLIEKNNLTEKWTTIRTYIDNWQPLCSNIINKTLEEKFVCEEIYYFIVDKNYNYTKQNIFDLSKKLKDKIIINENLLEHYIENYNELCYLNGHSLKLPIKPISILTIDKRGVFNFTNCSIKTGNVFLDLPIPLFKIDLGNDLTCEKIDKLRIWFYLTEDENKNIYWNGVKVWYVLILSILITIIIFWKTGKLEKIYDRFTEGKFSYEK